MNLGTGKRFAYYDKERRESHPWGEPAQRQIIIKEDGRFKYVYEDGTTAEGVLSPTAIKHAIEVIIAENVQIISEPETNAGSKEAAEAVGPSGKAA